MSKLISNAKKFKELVEKSWYIALPVHVVTSGVWFGGAYGATKMGLDCVPFLEKTGLAENYLKVLKTGNIGHVAQALVMYKIVTPLRYATTLGLTKSIITLLKRRGTIK